MRSWDDYKKTMRNEDTIFEEARSGNLGRLKAVLSLKNINEKDSKGYSPLMLAAYNGHYDASKFLLEMKADPNSEDHSGNSILMGVAFKGHLDLVKLLIEHGADPDKKNPKNQTALQFAQMFGRTEVANFLSKSKRFNVSDQISSWLTFVFPKWRS